jgi:CubicO group peptidase (beta-lactamase class C family)
MTGKPIFDLRQGGLSRRDALVSALALAGTALARPGFAANDDGGPAGRAIDTFMQAMMTANPDQPGLGVAVVEDGRITLVKGYGVRRLGDPAPVTDSTLFGIASNTKAMTAAALAILVDEGRVDWDAPVTRYLPDFAMSDETVTRMLTVRDLLVHRSGLSLGAGDLMIWPSPTHTRQDIVAGLRHLPISGRFRDGYAYDNVLYVVAGAVIEAVSGQTWEDFIQARILTPIGMTDATPLPRSDRMGDSAYPHTRLGPPVRGLGPQQVLEFDTSFDAAGAAGGVNASARDMARWMQVQLAHGALPDGRRLWSEEQAGEMWRPQTIVSSGAGPTPGDPSQPIIQGYALGWFVRDYRGERMLTHTGGLAGFISVTALLPGRRSGVMVMTNAEESPVLRAARYGGLDRLMGRSDFDWIGDSLRIDRETKARVVTEAAAITSPTGGGAAPALPLSAYAGVYRDPWYGTITVSLVGRGRNQGLRISFDKTPRLRGALLPFDGETFQTRFEDRTQEDAFMTFESEAGVVRSATMRAISPLADFSYDYHDLVLTREG